MEALLSALFAAVGLFFGATYSLATVGPTGGIPASGIMDYIMGPFGALAFALVAIWWLAKWVLRLISSKDALYEKQIADQKELIKRYQEDKDNN